MIYILYIVYKRSIHTVLAQINYVCTIKRSLSPPPSPPPPLLLVVFENV